MLPLMIRQQASLSLCSIPRIQNWETHFELKGAIIQTITQEGHVIVKILHLNDEDRVVEEYD